MKKINKALVLLMIALSSMNLAGCKKKEVVVESSSVVKESETYGKAEEDKNFGMSLHETKAKTYEELEHERFVSFFSERGYEVKESVYLEDEYSDIERSRQFKDETNENKIHLVTLARKDNTICMMFIQPDEKRILSYKDYIISNANSNCKEQRRGLCGSLDIKQCLAKSKQLGKLDVYTIIDKDGIVYLMFESQSENQMELKGILENYSGLENGEVIFNTEQTE